MSNVVKHTEVYEDHYYSYQNKRTAGKERPEYENKELTDAKYQALKLIAEAREEAQKIKKSAEIIMENEIERATKEAYEKGFALGTEKAKVEAISMLREAIDLLNELKEHRESLLAKNEQMSMDLSLAIAKKIIGTELQTNENAFLNLYQNAVQEFISEEWVKITVSDWEYDFATEHAELLLSMIKGAKYIDIKKMKGAPTGTCIVETASGIANASVDTQLSVISQALSKMELSKI